MRRREFSAAAAGSVALQLTAGAVSAGSVLSSDPGLDESELGQRFQLRYAPHFGHFRHHAGEGYLAQVRFAAEIGFTAWEDQGMLGRPIDLQEQVAGLMADREMAMGPFIGYASFRHAAFTDPCEASRRMLRERMEQVIECAKRVNARWTTIVPGVFVKHLSRAEQVANVIESLRRCADRLEPEGIGMVLGPLHDGVRAAGVFPGEAAEAHALCTAVGSPSCKVLTGLGAADLDEENLIANLDKGWEDLAYVQIRNHPNGGNPGLGRSDYGAVLGHLHKKGFQGVIGMEHGNSQEGRAGEVALIKAYQQSDNFPQPILNYQN